MKSSLAVICGGLRWFAMVCVLALFAAPAAAEPPSLLHVATWTYASTIAADQVSTGWSISRGAVEADKMVSWAGPSTAGIVTASLALDAGMFWAVHRWIAPKHQKIAAVLLFTKSAMHVQATISNAQLAHQLGCASICLHAN